MKSSIQIALLLAMITSAGGVLWWRLQPPPPPPAPLLPIPPRVAALGKPLKSELLPLTFEFPVRQERNNLERFEYNGGTCMGLKEAFYWFDNDVLKFVGAPKELIDFKISYDPEVQPKQQPIIQKRRLLLEKTYTKIIKSTYTQMDSDESSLLGTSGFPAPDGTDIKTYGGQDMYAWGVYHGKNYSSYFHLYEFSEDSNRSMYALTICLQTPAQNNGTPKKK